MLGLEVDDDGQGGMANVDVWVIDARRPWNLSNVFGAQSLGALNEEGALVTKVDGINQGKILQSFRPGEGGIFVFDDGDIEEELGAERDAYCALAEMPELGDDDGESDGSVSESDAEEERIPESGQPLKRKSSSDDDTESGSDAEEGTPRKKRRSNSVGLPFRCSYVIH
jgi:cell division control protein 45